MKKELLESSEKWRRLGIETILIKVEAEHRSKKLYRQGIRLYEGIEIENIPDDFNFLAIDLNDCEIFCLDIEGTPGSVENFYSLLEKRGIDHSGFVYENTMNKGLHIYFRKNGMRIKNEHFKRMEGIDFDVLTRRRAFTSPSSFNKKEYKWINDSFGRISSINDFPKFPESLLDFIDI